MKRRLEEIFCKEPEKRVKMEESYESYYDMNNSNKGRQDNSLGVLTRKFLDLIKED
jgi:hypothetical protein